MGKKQAKASSSAHNRKVEPASASCYRIGILTQLSSPLDLREEKVRDPISCIDSQ